MDSAVRLHVESRGPADGAPVLLIQGLGQQLIDWPEALVSALAARCRVILCDNRDAGLSPLAGPAADPALRPSDFPTAEEPAGSAPYMLHDMAADMRAVGSPCGRRDWSSLCHHLRYSSDSGNPAPPEVRPNRPANQR